MRIIIIVIIMGMLHPSSFAQKVVEKRCPIKSGDQLTLNFKFADDIIINTWNKNEVLVKVTYSINNGKHDENFELKVNEQKKQVEFESLIHKLKDISIKEIISDDDSDDVHISHRVDLDFTFEVFAPTGVNIDSETIDGDYTIKSHTGISKIKTISGNIDASLPKSIPCNFELATISGEMYTDFEFTTKDSKDHNYFSSEASFSVNGGGKTIKLKTISGDIFLRKQ